MLDRRYAAMLACAEAAIIGYALLRIQQSGGPPARSVGPSMHIPYFWRLLICGWWGILAGLLGWRFPQLTRVLERLLWPGVVFAVGVALVLP